MRTKVHMDAIEATPHLLGCHVDGVSFTQVDFYDRSVLGEGIHCLKCGSFVNLPRDGDPMVQCPYCAYRWCVRCKCPWHPNIKCSERADVEVEEWREAHGAQRCPGCFKQCINQILAARPQRLDRASDSLFEMWVLR